jgi:uncharacterized protein (TIGR03792 family)
MAELCASSFRNVDSAEMFSAEMTMVIECLKIHVAPALRERFVQKDEEIWTPMLSAYPAFLGKEVWISPDELSEVVLIIRWESFEGWQSIPAQELQRVESEFNAALNGDYEIVDSSRYQVRKFLREG